jgi:hypothetical protein
MEKREPSTRRVAPSSANATMAPFVPGYSGKRYGVCDDKIWHLVLKVYDDGMTDVQCSENVRVVQPQPPTEDNDFPMCEKCVLLHFGNTSSGK